MVFNNDDLNDLINISNNAINNWLGEIYLLTIRIQEFINSDSFTGNASKAIKTYLQEVHLQTLIPEITMLLNDYQSKLALYSKEYAEIDEDYHKVINTDVLDDLISFYITDDLNVCYDYFSGILSEISDIIELTNPSNDKANNSCARFRYRISKLEYSINGIENKTSFEGTQPLCTYCDSLDKLLTNAISRSESSVTSYMPGQFQMSELYKNASLSYIKSINYYNDHEKEIKIATQYCKDVSEKIYEEKLQKYQDELEKKQKSAKKLIRLNGAVKGLSGILQLASGYGLFAAAPATAGTSIIPGGSFIVFGTSDLIEGLGEVFTGEDQKNPLCEAAFFGDEKAYHVVNFIYTIVSPIILNKITGPCTIGGKVSDIAGRVEGGSSSNQYCLSGEDHYQAYKEMFGEENVEWVTRDSLSSADRIRIQNWKHKPSDELYIKYKSVYQNDLYFDQATGETLYPPEAGFLNGKYEYKTIQANTVIDRIGGDGKYFSPEGTSYGNRALPPYMSNQEPIKYKVLKDFDVKSGTIAPWFDEPGGGIQYFTDDLMILTDDGEYVQATLQNLLDNDYIMILE